jgi:hypothetical protein
MARKIGALTSLRTPADLTGPGKPYRRLSNLW